METSGFLGQLERDGTLLATAAAAAEWDAAVPGITWSVRDVVVHVGAVHRWCADIVRRQLTRNETGGSSAFRPRLADDDVLDWYADGLAGLVSTLATAPDDLTVWAFGPAAPAARFWSRRQAHETAIHRADVEAGAGHEIVGFDAGFAQDGLHEVVAEFARGFTVAGSGRLALLASDGDDWLVTFDGGAIVGNPATDLDDVDATVTGSSSDLYRWAWNRPSPAVVAGDRAVAALWREVRIT